MRGAITDVLLSKKTWTISKAYAAPMAVDAYMEEGRKRTRERRSKSEERERVMRMRIKETLTP